MLNQFILVTVWRWYSCSCC